MVSDARMQLRGGRKHNGRPVSAQPDARKAAAFTTVPWPLDPPPPRPLPLHACQPNGTTRVSSKIFCFHTNDQDRGHEPLPQLVTAHGIRIGHRLRCHFRLLQARYCAGGLPLLVSNCPTMLFSSLPEFAREHRAAVVSPLLRVLVALLLKAVV